MDRALTLDVGDGGGGGRVYSRSFISCFHIFQNHWNIGLSNSNGLQIAGAPYNVQHINIGLPRWPGYASTFSRKLGLGGLLST